MATINYYDGKQTVKLEVSDEFAATYNEIVTEERRADERYKWELRKRISSLDLIDEMGGQIEDPNSNFAETFVEYDDLHNAISQLLPEQQELIRQIYFEGRTMEELANELGVDGSAIRHRMQRVMKKIKNILC